MINPWPMYEYLSQDKTHGGSEYLGRRDHYFMCGSKPNIPNDTPSQQTQNIYITFVQRRNNVFDVGPTLYKYHTNRLYLLVWCHYVHNKQYPAPAQCWVRGVQASPGFRQFRAAVCRHVPYHGLLPSLCWSAMFHSTWYIDRQCTDTKH